MGEGGEGGGGGLCSEWGGEIPRDEEGKEEGLTLRDVKRR